MIPVEALPREGTRAYLDLTLRPGIPDEVRKSAQNVLLQVREGGDRAVLELTERFDGVRLESTRVSTTALDEALKQLDPGLRGALEEASAHIAAAHSAQRFKEVAVDIIPGVRVWREWRPLQRVGLYVPGGRAPYVSSVLMLAVPARLAGCKEIVLCSPPPVAGPILAAAALAGVTEVHAIGGVQAIGAMAYGTESLRRVDKVFGPGNAYVTAAKLMVFGEVAIDMPAGPSEILILTDGSVPAPWVAADLLAQAEHSPDATAILVSIDRGFATDVQRLLPARLAPQVRLRLASDIDQAIAFANAFAPEHLTLACADPGRLLPEVRSAGSVFLGAFAAAAAADYATGANHVLPTGGAARAFSALGLDAFGRVLQVQQLDREGLRRLEPVVSAIAGAEAMVAHAESVRVRGDATPEQAARATLTSGKRSASRTRATRETQLSIRLVLDGHGTAGIDTGLPFLDHLLRALAVHARFDLDLLARGDLEVDSHHTVEDVAIVLGESLGESLGDRGGISRFGDAVVPLDESQAQATVDLGGRGYAVIDLPLTGNTVGSLPSSLVSHFLETFALRGGLTLHVSATGRDDHHLAEAAFKALARALRQACAVDASLDGAVASTK